MNRQVLFGSLLIAAGLPLALRLVPRNVVWGWRTRETLASREAWRRANTPAGIAMTLAGVWLLGLSRLHPAMRLERSAVTADVYLVAPIVITVAALIGWARRRRQASPLS